jgi:hypothetical protein
MTTEEGDKKDDPRGLEELLEDDGFIAFRTHPDDEGEAYWSEALEEGRVDRREFELAGYFIRSVQVRPEPVRQEEIDSLWEDIEIANKRNLRKKKSGALRYVGAVSGVAVLFLFLLNYFGLGDVPAEWPASGVEHVKAPDAPATNIQLVLSGDETLYLEGKEIEIAYNEEGIAINNERTALHNRQATTAQARVFNQLIVPWGKRSMLSFPEGSRMWVNAGTRVVYPAVFDKDRREIYVDGEVYLEVSPDKNRPFVVKTEKLEVEVLGTSFDIMAYEKDSVQNIVLVSGKVKIHSAHAKETILAPSEIYSYSNGRPEIKSVDVENYITWKSGIYQYESETLERILKRLSRYYGKEIICSPQVARLKCSGKLDLKDELQAVLNGIAQTAPVVCYYNGDQYIVTNN